MKKNENTPKFRINGDTLPVVALLFVVIEELHLGVQLMMREIHTQESLLNEMWQLTDNLMWMPMLVFFIYFYMYRVGRASSEGMKNASICVLLIAVAKFAVLIVAFMSEITHHPLTLALLVVEFLSWIAICVYIVAYWRHGFRLKKHRHRHGHSH